MSDFFSPDLGNLTATAILGWYAWHTASRTIPDLLKAFREELATAREECRIERETLRDELNAERFERHSDHMAIVEALHQLAAQLKPSAAQHAAPGHGVLGPGASRER
ncbi:MAG TPA: hypothetical protein VHD36_08410 [Pirellulales bacterium]|nr:hypothetical protein [Pirellulales bacterium]